MKTLNDFGEFVRGDFSQVLSALEDERNAYWRYFLKTFVIILSIVLVGIIIASGTSQFSIFLICLIAFGGVLFLILCSKRYSAYAANYKNRLVGGIIKFIDDSLSYSPFACIPESKFLSSNIFSILPDRYTGSDYVAGIIGQTEIEFSFICAEYKTETTSRDYDGNTKTEEHWHTIFNGVFFIADFNKHFSSQVLLWPDRSWKFLKTQKKKFSFLSGWQVINLEDPEFEEYYIAY